MGAVALILVAGLASALPACTTPVRVVVRNFAFTGDRRPAQAEQQQQQRISPWPDQACPASVPATEARAARLELLKQTIRAAVLTTKPHATSRGASEETVFSGNYDWHSAVHAHWALLALARVTRDRELERFLGARLTPRALEREREFLADPSNADFEMPYGQSWLLMMLDELWKRHSMRSPVLARLRAETEERVLGWLEKSPFPEKDPPDRFVASHRSWLFGYLLTQMSHPRAHGARKRLEALRRSKIDPVRELIAQVKYSDYDFLDLSSVLKLVDATAPHPARPEPLPGPLAPEEPFHSPIVRTNAHTAGRAMVRIWPRAVESDRGDAMACARFNTRMNEMFARTDQWADEFATVSHWVPQFMWMGLWLEQGRP